MAVLVRSQPVHTNTAAKVINAFTVPKIHFLLSVPSNFLAITSRCHLQSPNFSPSFLPIRSRPAHCLAAKPGRPSPDSDQNSESSRGAGFEASLSKFQDRVQIFVAVLFWMSLFFWTCAWDDRNNPNKRSRFRQ